MAKHERKADSIRAERQETSKSENESNRLIELDSKALKKELDQERNRKLQLKRIGALLGCIVVFVTAFALMVPAISVTSDKFAEEMGENEAAEMSQVSPEASVPETEESTGETNNPSEGESGEKPGNENQAGEATDSSQESNEEGAGADQSSESSEKPDEGEQNQEATDTDSETTDDKSKSEESPDKSDSSEKSDENDPEQKAKKGKIKKTVITASDETYEITVTYKDDAKIPENAELFVKEILPENDDYSDYYDQAIEKLEEADTEEGPLSSEQSYARFFDIEIRAEDDVIEPKAPVDVCIRVMDASEEDNDSLQVVHFAEEGPEVLDSKVKTDKDDGATEMRFEAESFSVYGVIVSPEHLNVGNYMVVVKHGDSYYLIRNDGALQPAPYDPERNSVSVADPMLWKYTGDHLYHESREVGFNDVDLASDFYYRYIDPNSPTGLSNDDETNTDTEGQSGIGSGVHITQNGRTIWNDVAITYTDGKLQSNSAPGNYLGVAEEDGHLALRGQASVDEAVEVFFATAANVSNSDPSKHTVNHIDISITGTSAVDVPLAFGKYYDENHEVVMEVTDFTKLHLSNAQVVNDGDLIVEPKDMKNATITAHLNNGESLDDAFYITGYSGNAAHAGGDIESSAQVRIEGSFEVAHMPEGSQYEQYATVDSWRYEHDESYRNAVHEARKANIVNYSITVKKEVEFWLQTPVLDEDGNPVLDGNGNETYTQLYDADGNKLKIKADVSFSDSFNYWDEGNECPVLREQGKWYSYDTNVWRSGGIATNGFSGMDFKLGGTDDSSVDVYALEITKIVVDENGNRIRSNNAGTNKFYVYKRPSENPEADGDLVKDLNVGSFTEMPDYSGYSLQREKPVAVGVDGIGTVYDYDVSPSLYYIKEDPDSIEGQITDTSGKTWDYKNTYILTEYAWRNHENDNHMHVSDTFEKDSAGEYEDSDYNSVPEILGMHRDYNYDGVNNTKTYTNDFLEFYVYNVYESPKVDVPVEKSWDAFEGDEYDWQATFKLQWAPLYPEEDTPNTNFVDVAPQQTLTISKTDMASISQELIDRYLADDPSLTEEEIAAVEKVTFKNLPKYGTDANGNTYRIQYSLEETSYRVTNAATGVIIYSWNEEEGYNNPEESTHYQPFYPHDAGETEAGNTPEQNEADANYYIQVRNAPKNVRGKEEIDVSINKQWDESFGERENSWYAEFELKRFVHTEYRDLSHMSDSDRAAEELTLTVNNGGETLSTLEALPNLGLYLGCNFKPHTEAKSVTFTAEPAVTLANGSRVSTITVTAEGSNASNALVRSQEFFVTQDTVFTITEGQENLIDGANSARVLDTSAGSPPLPDRTFSQTIRLDNTNNWTVNLEDLVRSETHAGDDDDNENVVYYEYYLVEKESNPDGYAQFFHADGNGQPTDILSGDSDHQIETDESIVALNGPSNRLIVKKLWRGVSDTTGFPGITFTLYQTWEDENNGNGWVYQNEQTGAKYENVELKGNNLEWICPEELPKTRVDNNGVSRNVKYYVVENTRSGSQEEGSIRTSWEFYYYRNSNGVQTNAGHQGHNVALTGEHLAENGGTITICNRLNAYIQMDIQKQFFEIGSAGSWGNTTAERARNAVLGFKVIRAIRTSDGKWLNERGQEVDSPVWTDYSGEMLCGYGPNGEKVVKNDEDSLFWLWGVGQTWEFRIENNWGDATDANAGGSGLPSYGFYIRNGEDIPVEYWYSYRETNVYKDVDRTPYPEWDWYSSITPQWAYGPNQEKLEAFPKACSGQDAMRVANFKASDLIVDKEWVGGRQPEAKAVYVKVWRKDANGRLEDFTAVIADDIRNNNGWQNYVDDASVVDLNRNCLIIPTGQDGSWSNSVKVNNVLVRSVDYDMTSTAYSYYIQEIGYRTNSGEYRTDVNGRFKPLYDKWIGSADGGSYTDAPVGMNEYERNNITIGAKGENRLKVINRTTPSTSYRVTKSFYGEPDAGHPSSVTGKYPTDGSKQAVIMLQQRYRYEKTEGGIEYVSADNETWVPKDSEEAATTWTVDWQAAESASPVFVALPLDKPNGSILTDEAWYGSAAAWTYMWEGLDVEKVLAEEADPNNARKAQLYYRAVEVSAPDWFNSVIADGDQDGHQAIDDNTQNSAGILLEKNGIVNERETCSLKLDKQWTSLDGPLDSWPEGYKVYYQVIQSYHLASASISGEDEVDYSYGPAFKKYEMTKQYTSESKPDTVHQLAASTIENDNGITLTGLPLYGFLTATEEDVEEATDAGIVLVAGKVYPVVYTYSAKETKVTKTVGGEEVEVGFRPQTVEAEIDGAAATENSYKALFTNEVVNIEAKKTWNGLTPGENESATIQLRRFKKDIEPEPETTFPVTVNVSEWGAGIDENNDGYITVTFTAEGKEPRSIILSESNGWSSTVDLDKGSAWDSAYAGDGSVVDSAVEKVSGTTEGITEENATDINLKGYKKQTGISVRVYVGSAYYNTDNGGNYGGNMNVSDMQEGYADFVIKDPDRNYEVVFSGGHLDHDNNWSQGGITLPAKANGNYAIEFSADSNFVIRVDNTQVQIQEGVTSYEVAARAQYTDPNMVPDSDGTVVLTGNNGAKRKVSMTPGETATITRPNADYYSEWGITLDGTPLVFTDNTATFTVKAEGTTTLVMNDPWWRTQDLNAFTFSGSISGMRALSAPKSMRSSAMLSAPLRAPESLPWNNDTDGLPNGANPDTDEVVDEVTFSGNTWTKSWSNLEKYSTDGKEYVYYIYESDYEGAAGSTGMETSYTVDEDGVLVVENTPTYPDFGNLKVQKELFYRSALNTQVTGKTFTVGLFTDANGENRVAGTEYQTITVSEGRGETTFSGLASGSYYVFEIVNGSPVTTNGSEVVVDNTHYTVTYTDAPANVEAGQTATVTVTNSQAPYELNLLKVDASDHEILLDGAVFKLNELVYNAETQTVSRKPNTEREVTTANGGQASFDDLAFGYYEVKESEMPAGYVMKGDDTFYVKVGGNGVQMVIRQDGVNPDEWETVGEYGLVTFEADDGEFTATVGNESGAALPNTGGSGTLPYALFGILLIMTAGTILLARRGHAEG